MSTLPFIKMQAQGNDFVIFDGRSRPLPELDGDFIRRLADRRLGVGCDQLLVVLPSAKADAALRIYNNDGSEAENCGNGLRCIAQLLFEAGDAATLSIQLNDRMIEAERCEAGIRVHMGGAKITDRTQAHVDVDMGNPHRVFFEATEHFPADRNIEIVSGQIGDDVYADIIERGVGHTPSCGSGACAIAAAIWKLEGHSRPQTIHMPGGEVTVSGGPDDVRLEGAVSRVFAGEISL